MISTGGTARSYKGRSVNKLQKWHHSVNFQNMKNKKYTFCRKFNLGHMSYTEIFMSGHDVTIFKSLVLEEKSVQYTAHQFSFTTRHMINSRATQEKNKKLSCHRETAQRLGHTLRETDRWTDRKP